MKLAQAILGQAKVLPRNPRLSLAPACGKE